MRSHGPAVWNVLQQMMVNGLVARVQRLIPYIRLHSLPRAFDWIDANPELIHGSALVVVGLGAFF